MTDQSVFTWAIRNYEAILSEYANKKKYKINTIGHSKNNKTSTEFSLNEAFEQTDLDKVLQSIGEIDLTETNLIEKQLFNKNKQSLRIKKQNILNKYFNYFNNSVDQIDIKKLFFQILANMFYKNNWNNFWTQFDKIKYFFADVNDQRCNQNNDENSSNINNPIVNLRINDNPSVGQFQNQTENIGQDFNMFETEELWYY